MHLLVLTTAKRMWAKNLITIKFTWFFLTMRYICSWTEHRQWRILKLVDNVRSWLQILYMSKMHRHERHSRDFELWMQIMPLSSLYPKAFSTCLYVTHCIRRTICGFSPKYTQRKPIDNGLVNCQCQSRLFTKIRLVKMTRAVISFCNAQRCNQVDLWRSVDRDAKLVEGIIQPYQKSKSAPGFWLRK